MHTVGVYTRRTQAYFYELPVEGAKNWKGLYLFVCFSLGRSPKRTPRAPAVRDGSGRMVPGRGPSKGRPAAYARQYA